MFCSSFKNVHTITLLKPTQVNESLQNYSLNEPENFEKEVSIISFHEITENFISVNTSRDQQNQSEQSSISSEVNGQVYKQATNHEEIIQNILGEHKTHYGLKMNKQKRKELLDEANPENVMIGESTESLVS